MISRVVAVEIALTSYQCGLGQIPGLVKLFVGSLYFAWKYFSPSGPEMARLVNEFEAGMVPDTGTKENSKHHEEHRMGSFAG